jgi:hypothetical protein
MPLFFATPAIAQESNGITVTITTDQQITTTSIALKQAGDDLQIVTKELTDATAIANTLSPTDSVTASINLATGIVNEAISNLLSAQTALLGAQDAAAALIAAQAAYDLASVNLSTSSTELAIANAALIKANADVAAQQNIVNSGQAKLNALKATPTNGYTYTTDGYVAPTPSASPVSSTVRLPQMWDASTRIDVPFDIKLGNVLYEGQGAESQIYVTSKAFMSFGGPDFTFGGWPNIQGIYVYQSDWMSAGSGAYIDVTTTDTTLKIEWSIYPFGNANVALTNVVWNMTVNPTTGEWTGYSTISGNTNVNTGGPRIGVRETSGGTINNMTPVPSDPTLIQKIEDQTVIVNGQKTTLQTLINTRNTILLVVQNKQVIYDSSVANATSTSVVRNKAVTDLASAINNAEDLTEAVVISVKDADSQVETTYIVVSAEKAIQSYVPPAPVIVPTPEPTTEPEPTPDPEPIPEPEPSQEPTPDPEPEPTTEPEPETEIEVPTTEAEAEAAIEELSEIAPEELTIEQAAVLLAAAEMVLETAQEGSEEYEAALDALAVVAQADDPELPQALADIPGAAEVLAAFNALGNMGADMSPAAREEAEKVVVAGIVAVNAALNAAMIIGAGTPPVPSAPSAPAAGATASASGTARGKG